MAALARKRKRKSEAFSGTKKARIEAEKMAKTLKPQTTKVGSKKHRNTERRATRPTVKRTYECLCCLQL